MPFYLAAEVKSQSALTLTAVSIGSSSHCGLEESGDPKKLVRTPRLSGALAQGFPAQ